jgi:hypothetical protein
MAHLNLYLPDDVAAALRQEADSAKLPLSRYVSSLLMARTPGNGWLPGYFDHVCGFLAEEIPEPLDALPEPLADLDLLM